MTTSQTRFKWTDDKLINLIKCLEEFDSSYVNFSFLSIDWQWLQGFEVIIMICINLLMYYKFQLFVDCSYLCFDLFLPRFRFSFLTFIKFHIYPRLLYFNPGWNFSYNYNFFQLVIPSWNFNPGWKSPYHQPLNFH